METMQNALSVGSGIGYLSLCRGIGDNKMNVEEKYQRAVEALQEIALGRGPYKMDPQEFAASVIKSMRDEARQALTELGEEPKEEWENNISL